MILRKKGCALCEMKHMTRWYYFDEDWVICDCLTCKIPMLVYRYHVRIENVPAKDLLFIIEKSMVIFSSLGGVRFRGEQRNIKDHFHWHILVDDVKGLDNYDDVK